MRLATLRRSECLSIAEMVHPLDIPEERDAILELGKHRPIVVAWLDALRPVVEGPRAGRGARIAVAAQNMGVPVKTARNRYDALQREGWRGLLDKRQRDSAAKMQDFDCTDRNAFSNWIKAHAENYGGNLKHAHRAVIAFWKQARKSGEKIPGYAAWPLPGIGGYPVGWSYGNIAKLAKLTTYERTLSCIGRAAAHCHAPTVIRTRVGLHVGEVLMIDDGWHDVDCHMLGSQKDFVRALELAVLDVYSAHKPTWGIKPRVRDEATNKRINLRANDMRFLVAHHFCNVGYYPERCLVFMEHGTAVVEPRVQAILKEYSNNAIQFITGGIQDKPAILGAWTGRKGGNPRLKAAIESSWRLIHFAAKALPGQTGGDSRNNLPEDHHGREGYHKELVSAIEHARRIWPEEKVQFIINSILSPVMAYQDYAKLVAEFYHIISCYTDHDLEGWDEECLAISGFRPSVESLEFFPYAHLAKLPPDQAEAVSSVLRANPELNVRRRMSRLEVFNAGKRALRRLPIQAFAEICGADLAVRRTVRAHSIQFDDCEIKCGYKFRFPAIATDQRGNEIILKDGQSYNTLLNPYDPSRLFIMDENFAVMGTLSEQIAVSYADPDAMHQAIGKASHAESLAMLPYRMRHADREGEVQRMREHNKELLSGMVATPEERAVRARAEASAQAGDMDALLSACGQPTRDVEPDTESPADLSTIFGPTPGSQD